MYYRPTGAEVSVTLRNLQLDQQGLYTCKAENGIGGSDSITYDVKVYGMYCTVYRR